MLGVGREGKKGRWVEGGGPAGKGWWPREGHNGSSRRFSKYICQNGLYDSYIKGTGKVLLLLLLLYIYIFF